MHTLTKVVSLSEQAYKALKKRKGKGESFSDVVLRLTSERSGSILELAGAWVGGDADIVAQQVAYEREAITAREHRF